MIYLRGTANHPVSDGPEFESTAVIGPDCLLLQDLALCCLRVSKVHHLVQQFVDDDEVIPDTLLLQHLEVFGEDLHDLVEEQKNFGGICVSLGQSENVEIAVADI